MQWSPVFLPAKQEKKKLTVLFPYCFLPPLVVFVQNKYTGGLCIFLQTQIYTCYIQTAVKLFLFTLPPSFPLDIFARCHLWNTVATQRDVSWACLTEQAVGSLIKAGGTAWKPLQFSQADAAGCKCSAKLDVLCQLISSNISLPWFYHQCPNKDSKVITKSGSSCWQNVWGDNLVY